MKYAERMAVISGLGQSEIGRPSEKSIFALTIDACLQAIDDAGLAPADIDGLTSWPGPWETMPGLSPIRLDQVKESLGLELNWYNAGLEAPAQLASIINACAAVAGGLARHVLCFRSVAEATRQSKAHRASVMGSDRGQRIPDVFQWQIPFQSLSGANFMALYAQRHMHEFGTTREQLAQIALNGRRNAALNPRAIYRSPLTMQDYLQARIISSPLVLYDCDVPIDGSVAIVVSHVDAARDSRSPPIFFESVGCSIHGRYSVDQYADLTSMPACEAARMLWARTDLRPKDVDVAELYDGFSFITLAWLEALGFCNKGESGAFVEGGARIALDGELPLNTNGGQLSAGRQHGYGLLHEACVQLRGGGERRQVSPRPKVAVVSNGGGPVGSCILLRAADA